MAKVALIDDAKFYVTKVPKAGDVGPEIKILQNRLKDAGFSPGKADGFFGPKTLSAVKKFQKSLDLPGSGKIAGKTLAALQMVVGNGDGLGPVKPSVPEPEKLPATAPTRVQMLAVLTGMCDGTIEVKNGPYKNIRETKGKNRSAEIDAIIKRQGGSLGQAYCQWGVQELVDELCAYYKVDRKKIGYPEGGGTQEVFRKAPAEFKVSAPAALCTVTWRHGNTSQGHVGMALGTAKAEKYRTFEFNTTSRDESKVVRDGQGAGYCNRRLGTIGDMHVVGYVDIYAMIIRAMQKA